MKYSRVIGLPAIIILITLLKYEASKAQSDSLIFSNGEMVIGEIKKMDRGVVTIETFYSDSDFKISWDRRRAELDPHRKFSLLPDLGPNRWHCA